MQLNFFLFEKDLIVCFFVPCINVIDIRLKELII